MNKGEFGLEEFGLALSFLAGAIGFLYGAYLRNSTHALLWSIIILQLFNITIQKNTFKHNHKGGQNQNV